MTKKLKGCNKEAQIKNLKDEEAKSAHREARDDEESVVL